MHGGLLAARRAALEHCLSGLLRRSGLPLVQGGLVVQGPKSGQHLRITSMLGVHNGAFLGLALPSGRGLGGHVLEIGRPRIITDYLASPEITHDYDNLVVQAERIVSAYGFPVVMDARVVAILFGASRTREVTQDDLDPAALAAAELTAQLRKIGRAAPAFAPSVPPTPRAVSGLPRRILGEVEELLARIAEPEVRARVLLLRQHLNEVFGEPAAAKLVTAAEVRLAPRELELLRLVAIGATNVQIAERTGLSYQTVKSYLRSAMHKLEAGNRTAAAHRARLLGLI